MNTAFKTYAESRGLRYTTAIDIDEDGMYEQHFLYRFHGFRVANLQIPSALIERTDPTSSWPAIVDLAIDTIEEELRRPTRSVQP